MTRKVSPKADVRRHYWLAAGQVVAVDETNEARISSNLNALIITDQAYVPSRELGKAQQTLQARFMRENFPEAVPAGIRIVDVFLFGVSALGQMSEAEFQEGYAELQAEQREAEKAAR